MYKAFGLNFNKNKTILTFTTIAVMLQVVVLFVVMDPNTLFWPDPKENYAIAKELANGLPYSTPDNEKNLGRAIGYPYFLSLVIPVVGPDLIGLRLVHLIFLPIMLLLIFALTQSWKNSNTALLALVMSVFYPYYLYVPLTLYPESILIFLYVCIAAVMQYARIRGSLYWSIFLATIIAFAIMVRPTAIIWIPVVLFYILWKTQINIHSLAKIAMPIIFIPVISVSAWMARNNDIHGSFFFTSKSSEMLLNAYNENSRWDIKHPKLPDHILKQLNEAKSISERQKIASKEAKAYIADNPGRSFYIAFMQMTDLWNPLPRTVIQEGYGSSKFKIIPAVAYTIILLLSIGGLMRNRKSHFVHAMILLLILNTLINGFFMTSVRYRMVTDFVLIMLAASYLEFLGNKYIGKIGETKSNNINSS